ncbi:MAG: DNA-directed RNA polymerase, subunit E'' [Ignisphaera sp.]|nr:DNA-directed RNA polymerase, subunit E'' [Ignisphaera sp.]MCX8168352.1 DNA-directed RNA polymerase, subunit E'' [Ignisphaera sp.]MDW8085315.1 transcription elongation factor subunit Spt4 [Ignisphaera sp.]
MSRGVSTKSFKACIKCKALLQPDAQKCPVCGSADFTNEWSGMVIIVDPEKSDVAKLLGIKAAGRYALKVGV